MQIIIPGDPIPKARHRSSIVNKRIVIYDSQKKEKDKVSAFLKKFIIHVQNGTEGYFELQQDLYDILLSSYFEVEMIFYMKMPKNASEKKKKMMQENEIKHTCKPDVSNMIKFYEDCANGIIWKDDKQIVKIRAEKRYARVPFTLLNIFGYIEHA